MKFSLPILPPAPAEPECSAHYPFLFLSPSPAPHRSTPRQMPSFPQTNRLVTHLDFKIVRMKLLGRDFFLSALAFYGGHNEATLRLPIVEKIIYNSDLLPMTRKSP